MSGRLILFYVMLSTAKHLDVESTRLFGCSKRSLRVTYLSIPAIHPLILPSLLLLE